MSTRRQFIRQVVGYGSASMFLWLETPSALGEGTACSLPPVRGAERYIPGESRILPRLSAADLEDPAHAAQAGRLRDAISRMKALPRNDVISWERQAAQPCAVSSGMNAASLHYSGRFLPWHRAYLYFFERILRRLAGDDDLRLVYWDWETLANRGVPGIYAEAGQSLYLEHRDYRGVDMKDIDVLAMLAVPTYELFGGGAAGNPGAVVSGPHANVHNAFGGVMSDLPGSAHDPVFHAHHANIDRLWSSWGRAGHSNPDFGQDRVYFYDETRKLRYILLNDLRDESRLGYQYSSYMTTSVHLKDLQVYRLARQGAAYTASKAVIDGMRGKESEASYLVLKNIRNRQQLPRETYIYGVFAGKPTVGWINHMDANYLGKVADIRSGGVNRHQSAPLTCALDVSERLAGSLRRQKGMLNLTLAPLDAAGRIVGPGVPLVADSVVVLR